VDGMVGAHFTVAKVDLPVPKWSSDVVQASAGSINLSTVVS